MSGELFEIDESVLLEALHKWGYPAQELMAIEEMAELTQAIAKTNRGRPGNVAEEIADVLITVTQIALSRRHEVQEAIAYKLDRLRERLKR